jgi:hypothetical protein
MSPRSVDQPERNRRTNRKIFTFGCLPALALAVLLILIVSVSNEDDGKTGATKPAAAPTTPAAAPGSGKPQAAPKPEKARKAEAKPREEVTFKIWGSAPAGVDITYSSDSDNRSGKWTGGTWTATLPFDDEALYYALNAQLQGGGDIQCSVTVDGKTKKAHASGDYNICMAQLNGGILGWD